MNIETLLVAAICLLTGLVVGYLLGSRRAEANQWTRAAPSIAKHAEPQMPPASRSPDPVSAENLPPEVISEIRAFLLKGQKISAIKRTREATGLGLKESKELVESWMR
ncbi:MAG: ribosomal protein L7/L12 [Pseudomonadota bacterium]